MDLKKKFWELYASNNLEDHGIASEIKKRILPQKLYRYRDLSEANMKYRLLEIGEGELFLSHVNGFNDPFEGYSTLGSKNPAEYASKEMFKEYYIKQGREKDVEDVFSREDWYDAYLEYLVRENKGNDNEQVLREQFNEQMRIAVECFNEEERNIAREIARIACFTTKDKNLPMWYHYADGHKGICLEYDICQIENELLIEKLFPVNYVEKLADIPKLMIEKRHPIFTLFEIQAAQKLTDWSYEDEWRLIYSAFLWYRSRESIPDDFWGNGKVIQFIRPSKVILGKDISIENENQIRACAEEKQIQVVKAVCTEYGLEFE